MPYQTPTLDELINRGRERHRSELPGTDAFLWPNTEHVFLTAVGGMVHEAFQYLDWIKRQRFALEADGDQLDEHGRQFDLPRRAEAAAHGVVRVTGTPGTLLADRLELARSDGARFFATTSAVVPLDGFVDLPVQAGLPGPGGNTVGGARMVPAIADAAITAVTVSAEGIGGGANVEDDESYRDRILFRMRYPPRGGAAHDYVAWALTVPGVTRVWVDPLAYGPGTVGVWCMADGNGAQGIPSPVMVGDVAAYIGAHKPVTAKVFVAAPVPAPIDVRIDGIGIPRPGVRDAIAAELGMVFSRLVHVSLPTLPYALPRTLLWQAVARATGGAAHRITIPSKDDVALLPGFVPVLGVIQYV